MSDMFKSYERDFSKHLAAANKKVSVLSTNPSELLIIEAKEDLLQAERCLKQMENELTTLSPTLAAQYQSRLKRHHENINTLKQSLTQQQFLQNRAALAPHQPGTDKRDKVIAANEVLKFSGDALERAIKAGVESEQIGNDTMNDLFRQRKQLQDINEKVHDVGTNMNKANKVISTMDRRRLCIKLLMYFIILLLIIAIGVVLYIKIGL